MPQKRCRHIAFVLAATMAAAAPAAAQVSNNVDFLGNVDAYGSYAACWGYVHTDGSEFAAIGTGTGTAIYDITNAPTITLTGFIAGPSSSWREIKSYGQYLYITTEGSGVNRGLQIVSMANPWSPVLVNTWRTTFNTAHSLFIDVPAGLCYVNGTDTGMRILNLAANPTSPAEIGSFNTYYVHDSYAKNGFAYLSGISTGIQGIYDAAMPGALVELRTWTWPGAAPHNCWTTDDQRYLLTTDETTGGSLRMWDVQNVGNIVQTDVYNANPSTSVHNVHVLGNLAYCSYYTEGVRVVEISDPYNIQEVGYYDTYPGASGGYNGCWGVFPYFPSGKMIASDISTGLWVLRFTANYGTVEGTVTDAATSLPIPGAAAVLVGTGKTATADGSGHYSLSHDPGNYTARFSAFGYDSLDTAVLLQQGLTGTQNAALTPQPAGVVSGTITDAGTIAGIAGASVVAVSTPRSATSGGAGDYALGSLPYGSYTISVDRFTYIPLDVPLVVSTPAVDLDVALAPVAWYDDFEANRGWTAGAQGDNATSGIWTRVDPNGTGGGGVQPEDDHTIAPGVLCFVTGQSAVGAGIGDNDVDGGTTTLLSPVFSLAGMAEPRIIYWRWYTNNAGAAPGEDTWRVSLSNDGGATWTDVEATTVTENFWKRIVVDVNDILAPSASMRLRFVASDLGSGSVVEAAVDDIEYFDASSSVAVEDPAPSAGFMLAQNAPNPFGPMTTIRFSVPREGERIRLSVYDLRGRLVRRLLDGPRPAGEQTATWDARDEAGRRAAAGVYLYALSAGSSARTRKMLLLP